MAKQNSAGGGEKQEWRERGGEQGEVRGAGLRLVTKKQHQGGGKQVKKKYVSQKKKGRQSPG